MCSSDLYLLINQERKQAGVEELSMNDTLNRLAQIKAKDLAANAYLAHTSPTFGSPFEMIRNEGMQYTAAAENIGRGQATAADIVSAWMASTGHQENILNPHYTQTGIGYATDKDGKPYWVQLFLRE